MSPTPTYDVAEDRERILELVPGYGVEFSGADMLRLRGPVVYLICRDDRPLYVGMSRNGLERPFSRTHRVGPGLTESDRLQVWPVASPADAVELEARLIRHLMPAWNINGRAKALAEHLGIRPKSLAKVRREIPAAPMTPTLPVAPTVPRPIGFPAFTLSREHRDDLRRQRRSRK